MVAVDPLSTAQVTTKPPSTVATRGAASRPVELVATANVATCVPVGPKTAPRMSPPPVPLPRLDPDRDEAATLDRGGGGPDLRGSGRRRHRNEYAGRRAVRAEALCDDLALGQAGLPHHDEAAAVERDELRRILGRHGGGRLKCRPVRIGLLMRVRHRPSAHRPSPRASCVAVAGAETAPCAVGHHIVERRGAAPIGGRHEEEGPGPGAEIVVIAPVFRQVSDPGLRLLGAVSGPNSGSVAYSVPCAGSAGQREARRSCRRRRRRPPRSA